MRTRTQIRERPDREHDSRPGPGQNRKTHPFQQFAEIVGAGDIVEHSPFRKIVPGISGLSQMTDDMIRLHVDIHSSEEDTGSDDELRRPQPRKRIIVCRRDIENPPSLHECIDGVENHSQQNDRQRHLAFSLHHEREDQRSLQIVDFEDDEKDEMRQLHSPVGSDAEEQHA